MADDEPPRDSEATCVHSGSTSTLTTMLDTANELNGGAGGFGGGAGTAAGFGGGGGGFLALKHTACPFSFGFGGGGGGGATLARLRRRGKESAPDDKLGASPPSLSEPERSAHRREGP